MLYIFAFDSSFPSRKLKILQPVEILSFNYFFEIRKNVTWSAARYLWPNRFLCRKTLAEAM